jgi:hypothetical protein
MDPWNVIKMYDVCMYPSAVNGYVTAVYDNHWWLGYVMEKCEEPREIHIQFLHSHGPAHLSHTLFNQMNQLFQ